jgi:hemoglobin-like flavoprotein
MKGLLQYILTPSDSSCGTTDAAVSHHRPDANTKSIVKAMMPLFYDDNEVTFHDITVCKSTWELIMSGQCAGMTAAQKLLNTNSTSGGDIFRRLFFHRFFDIHPAAIPLFSEQSVESGKFIASMVSMCLNQLNNPKGFRKAIVDLAEDHCRRAIRTIEYGVVGDVLFWSIRFLLGPMYIRLVEQSWVRIYSSMLRIIVPIAVSFEHTHGRIPRIAKRDINITASSGGDSFSADPSSLNKRGILVPHAEGGEEEEHTITA